MLSENASNQLHKFSEPSMSALNYSLRSSHEALVAANFKQVGTEEIFVYGNSAVILEPNGKIGFYCDLAPSQDDVEKTKPFSLCEIQYKKGLPIFTLQREGEDRHGIYSITGYSNLLPHAKGEDPEYSRGIRAHLLNQGFMPVAGSSDILRLVLPENLLDASHYLGNAILAIFEGESLISIFTPAPHYDAATIQSYDTIVANLPSPLALSLRQPQDQRAFPSHSDQEGWNESVHQSLSPPWDPIDTEMLEEFRSLMLEAGGASESDTQPESVDISIPQPGVFYLFNGSSFIPVSVGQELSIATASRCFLKEPSDEELGLPVLSFPQVQSGFQVGGVNQTAVIVKLTHINNRSIGALERDMRPEQASEGGFLGADEKLLEVLARDNDYVLAHGLTHQQIATPLLRIVAIASSTAHSVVPLGKINLQIEQNRGYMGSQESPFDDQTSGSCDLRIRNLKTGEAIWIPSLLPHMIYRYGFYEGNGSPYRVAPETLIRLLELTPHAASD